MRGLICKNANTCENILYDFFLLNKMLKFSNFMWLSIILFIVVNFRKLLLFFFVLSLFQLNLLNKINKNLIKL